MGNQDKTYAHVGIHKQSTLWLMCQNLLSEHISRIPFSRVWDVWLIRKHSQSLGIHIKPCKVCLEIDNKDMQYSWHVKDPKIQELFEKQLSKHSVGAYITLADEVGRSFWAIYWHSVNEVRVFASTWLLIISWYHSLELSTPTSERSAWIPSRGKCNACRKGEIFWKGCWKQ